MSIAGSSQPAATSGSVQNSARIEAAECPAPCREGTETDGSLGSDMVAAQRATVDEVLFERVGWCVLDSTNWQEPGIRALAQLSSSRVEDVRASVPDQRFEQVGLTTPSRGSKVGSAGIA
jgi:hypothetical protein